MLAISATYLNGLYMNGLDPFTELRKLTPDAQAGYSIMLYNLRRPEVLSAVREALKIHPEHGGFDGATRRSAIADRLRALFVAYAYFYQGGGWNQNSRFALVRAIVQQQTLRVDDTAYFDGRPGSRVTSFSNYKGHLYFDKAPGVALAAVPVVAPAARTFVEHPASREGIAILSYIATVLTAALPEYIVPRCWCSTWPGRVRGVARGGSPRWRPGVRPGFAGMGVR